MFPILQAAWCIRHGGTQLALIEMLLLKFSGDIEIPQIVLKLSLWWGTLLPSKM